MDWAGFDVSSVELDANHSLSLCLNVEAIEKGGDSG